MAEGLFRAGLGLLPVLCFLSALLFLDSYKLVKLRAVVLVVGAGALAAGAAYLVNGELLGASTIEFATFTRYGAPIVEELLKALVIALLVRANRVGFLVDAAILGFAVGTGFAVVENLLYLHLAPDARTGTWIVRGFLAGLSLAVVLHSAFNHFFFSPMLSTVGIVIAVPVLLNLVFQASEKAVGTWLGKGFDADAEMLALINTGQLSGSPVGRYLHSLKDKFQGPIVADILCYLRLHTELALRAKGILMMRESGFEAPVDEATRDKFTEMRYLEQSIGRTAVLALHPMLHLSHKDLWQLHMLGK